MVTATTKGGGCGYRDLRSATGEDNGEKESKNRRETTSSTLGMKEERRGGRGSCRRRQWEGGDRTVEWGGCSDKTNQSSTVEGEDRQTRGWTCCGVWPMCNATVQVWRLH